MDKNLTFTKSFRIEANVAAVWDALVNPEKIKIYLFGTEAISDWKVGSSLIFQGEWEGKAYKDKAIILAFEENKLFSYSYWSGFSGLEDIPENYSIISFELTTEGNATLINFNQIGFASEEARNHTDSNWNAVFEKIREIVVEE